MKIASSSLAEICQAQEIQAGSQNRVLTQVLIDSRQLSQPLSTVFFALAGHRRDGHDFIPKLYVAGVQHFVISQKTWDFAAYPGAQFILADDVLEALQDLAKFWRSQHDIHIIGITGSNGKTMVKEWLAHVVDNQIDVIKSPKSYNSQIGVPISVLQLHEKAELGIFEAGISTKGEMAKLADIIQPNVGILTNIGSAHDAGFVSRNEKLSEKVKLFEGVETLILQKKWQQPVSQLLPGKKLFIWEFGEGTDRDLSVVMTQQDYSTELLCRTPKQTHRISIPFQDDASVENAIQCIAAMHVLDQPIEACAARFQSLPPISMRLETLYGRLGCIIINDSYNADLEALRIAMSLAHQYPRMSKTLIISDFDQMPSLEALHNYLLLHLQQFGFAKLITVGCSYDHLQIPNVKIIGFESTAEVLQSPALAQLSNELVVLKGARRFRFEQIAELLSAKSYGGKLKIDLSALAANIKSFEALLDPKTQIMAMIKAEAYGSGALALAHNLAARGIDYLGVAYVDEGVELRRAGIQLPIMVLNTEEASITQLFQFRLEPEVHTSHLLRAIGRKAGQRKQVMHLHLNVNTGMSRLGFTPAEIVSTIEVLKQYPHLKVASILSHFAASDDPSADNFSREQGNLFDRTCNELDGLLGYSPMRHICNSNGIVRFPSFHFDMVRLGIGMYGINIADLDLLPVHTLTCRISQIREIPKGNSIGYGRSEVASRDLVIATIGIGYADGLIRKLGNRRYSVLVRGVQAPLVGNVCMDMAMIDVTSIPKVMVGDEVIIFGKNLPLERLAKAADTIPYEIFTTISQRVQRLYIQE